MAAWACSCVCQTFQFDQVPCNQTRPNCVFQHLVISIFTLIIIIYSLIQGSGRITTSDLLQRNFIHNGYACCIRSLIPELLLECWEQEKELQVLVLASQKSFNWTSIELELGFVLARLWVEECKSLLATLQDFLDDAHACAEDAHQQVTSMKTLFNQQGIHIDFHPFSFSSMPLQDYTLSLNFEFDMGSISNPNSVPDEDFLFMAITWCINGLQFFWFVIIHVVCSYILLSLPSGEQKYLMAVSVIECGNSTL